MELGSAAEAKGKRNEEQNNIVPVAANNKRFFVGFAARTR
jgi:hypothetical protein